MPSLKWYTHRLQTMPPSEIVWRVRSEVRDFVDRYRVAAKAYPSLGHAIGDKRPDDLKPGFRVADMKVGEWNTEGQRGDEERWYQELLEKADKIVGHRLSFFDLEDRFLGDPVDWNRDHGSGKEAPLKFSQQIDYRDFSVTGDCKYVWELNRHQHLVVLGRAYRASGNRKYAEEVVMQLDSWLDQCRFGMGMNWRSPLELGIRLINWVWSLDLILESRLFTGDFRSRVLHSVYLHLWDITKKYSRGSSANNHLIGEAAGVFIATSYFPGLRNAAAWRRESHDILTREILAQSNPDGATREQALGYHIFGLQFFLIAGLVGRWRGENFRDEYWSRLERMLEFLSSVSEGGGSLPMFGDCDDGYVLDLGRGGQDSDWLLSLGTVLFDRSDLYVSAGCHLEPLRWLLGQRGWNKLATIGVCRSKVLTPRAFEDSGYYLLQSGEAGSGGAISALFDCGDLGYGPIAAHGHADALSFTLRALGQDVFVDSGTYDYFTFPEWRQYFRSTRAHNTATIDDEDQSVMLGPFMWGEHAYARCLEWKPTRDGGRVSGEHDGYSRLDDPVIHRRHMEMDGANRILTIRDEIIAEKEHKMSFYFHLSEKCSISEVRDNRFSIRVGDGEVILDLDSRLRVETLGGSENPIAGWVSRGYHRKVPGITIVAEALCQGNASFLHRITVGLPFESH